MTEFFSFIPISLQLYSFPLSDALVTGPGLQEEELRVEMMSQRLYDRIPKKLRVCGSSSSHLAKLGLTTPKPQPLERHGGYSVN